MKYGQAMKARGNVVEFRDHRGIAPLLIGRLLEKGQEHGISSVQPFSIDQLLVANWVNLKCRYGCKKFGTSWCCPPATPPPEEARQILSEYSSALLLSGRQQCAGFYRDNERKRIDTVRYWKSIVSIERMLFLEGYYKAFALVSGVCSLCRQCAYPNACRFPQEKRPMIESFSIDVIGTLRNLGATSEPARKVSDEFDFHGIILLE